MKTASVLVDDVYNGYLLGDFHIGGRGVKMESIKTALKEAKNNHGRIILLGDLIESAIKTSPSESMLVQNDSPYGQYKEALDILMPYKDIIDCMIEGNHEKRIRRETSFDVVQEMAKYLGIPYLGKAGILRVSVRSSIDKKNIQEYFLFLMHGESSAREIETRIGYAKRCIKYLENIDAAIISHFHELNYIKTPKYREGNWEDMYIVFPGGFLEAEYITYGPLPKATIGYSEIILHGEKRFIEILEHRF